jgi:site-specific recombinase
VSDALLFDRHTFLVRFGAQNARNRPLLRLHELVTADEAWTKDNPIEWLEEWMSWLFERGQAPGRKPGESEPDCRTRLLLDVLEAMPSVAARLKAAVTRVLVGANSTLLFTDTGIPTHPGFWRELTERFSKNVLPSPPVGREVSRLVSRLLGAPERAAWLSNLPESSRRRLVATLGLDTDAVKRAFEPGLRDAAHLLAARIAMQGVSDDLRKRLPRLTVASTPFLQLPEQVKALLANELPLAKVSGTLDACRAALREVEASLDETGISVDLVFRLELLGALLTRLALVLTLLGGLEEQRELALVQLEKDLVRGAVADRSLAALWQSSTRLLARRVVERAGTSGEHYVTRTRAEQQAMLDAAAGGGAITALMVFTKFYIGWAKLPPFFDALAVGLNYAWGFVLMQLLHFALATKQPSMTAATLAGTIEAQKGEENPDLEPLVDLVARASRTQFTALVGNVFVVIPFALVLGMAYDAAFGRHLLSEEYALKTIRAHHPLWSVTLFSAAWTGVWLWLASLLAGAVENYFVLRELPGALASNRRLRRWLGPARAVRLSRFMTEQISGLGGNIGFGMLLGYMPMLFVLVGIPLEVRHVTFVTGQLVYAGLQLGPMAFANVEFLLSLLSIPMVGLVNFGVSFTCAIIVALRARGLGVRSQVRLAGAVLRRFARNPRPFILAPKETAATPAQPAAAH